MEAPIALLFVFGGLTLMYVVIAGIFPQQPTGGSVSTSSPVPTTPQISDRQAAQFQAAQLRFTHDSGNNASQMYFSR